MKLSKAAILALRGTSREVKREVSKELKITENTFYRWLSENNEILTKAGILAVISRIIELPVDLLLQTEEVEKVGSESQS